MCVDPVSKDSKSRCLSEGRSGLDYPKIIARTRNTMRPEMIAARTPTGFSSIVRLVSDATVDDVAAEDSIGSGFPGFTIAWYWDQLDRRGLTDIGDGEDSSNNAYIFSYVRWWVAWNFMLLETRYSLRYVIIARVLFKYSCLRWCDYHGVKTWIKAETIFSKAPKGPGVAWLFLLLIHEISWENIGSSAPIPQSSTMLWKCSW